MFAKTLLPLSMVLFAAACVPTANTPAPAAATTQTDAAGTGTYAGVLPCADCSGIETSLTLNADGTFAMTEIYQGKGKPFVTKGTYTLDKSGTKVTLIDKGDNGEHRSFKLGKDTLTALAMDGSAITGDMAAMYVLAKVK